VVEELCYAMKGDSLQIRPEGDNVNAIFWLKVSGCLGVAMEHDQCKNKRYINAWTDFEMVEVKVPIIFSYTVVFPLHREG
jgi:hypothetical protein